MKQTLMRSSGKSLPQIGRVIWSTLSLQFRTKIKMSKLISSEASNELVS